VCIDGISNSPFIHVRAKTRFYCRNHTKNYFCSTLTPPAQKISESPAPHKSLINSQVRRDERRRYENTDVIRLLLWDLG
jgi:hypothetical protein